MGCCCACWEDREWGAGLLLSARGPGRGDGLAPGARSFVAMLLRMTGRGGWTTPQSARSADSSPFRGSKEGRAVRERPLRLGRGRRYVRGEGFACAPIPQCAHWGLPPRGEARSAGAAREGLAMTGRGDGDLIRPSVRTGAPSALPQLPLAGLLRNGPPTARLRKYRPRFSQRPANGAAAEIPASLLLPQAAQGRYSPCAGKAWGMPLPPRGARPPPPKG